MDFVPKVSGQEVQQKKRHLFSDAKQREKRNIYIWTTLRIKTYSGEKTGFITAQPGKYFCALAIPKALYDALVVLTLECTLPEKRRICFV